ncbi:MAG: PP2C family protein-serine/threonine phosphatase [Sphingobacteriales bacterium]|nr:MAG: PP2C family protein-serine/threonine phosphatase [Sphingobacteriales bacterium]
MVKETNEKLKRQLLIKQLQIDSLLEVTKAINNNYSANTLFRIYEFILRAQMGVEKLIVFHKNNIWSCVCCYGLQGKEALIVNTNVEGKFTDFKDATHLTDKTNQPELAPFDWIIPVYHKDRPLAFLLLGEMKNNNSDTLDEKIKFIQTITNIIIVAIENKRLFKQQLQQERFKKELELAAQVQNMMVPKHLPDNETLQMSGVYLPHNNIGGDYYDFLPLNEHQFMVCIADISGKGIAAALLMANVQAVLRTLVSEELPLTELVKKLNRRVIDITGGEHFITLFIGKFNSRTRTLNYINAGHNPPILLADNALKLLEKGCTILGILDELPFINEGHQQLEPGNLLLSYTDGLVDLENEKGQYFTDKRLEDFILNNGHLPVSEMTQLLTETLDNFKGRQNASDDISFLSFKVF